MNRFILSVSILMISSAVFSQKQYFIYLQSEPEQSFYVKMHERVHNSNSSGYLIFSGMRDSMYTFIIGFPQNKWPEEKFMVDMRGTDHGFLLKNFGDKGWGLFDLQTSGIQMGVSTARNALPIEQREVSTFTETLSKAANDPSLKEKPSTPPVVIKEVKKARSDEAVNKTEELSVVRNDPPPVVRKEEPTAVKKEEAIAERKEDQPLVKKEVAPSLANEDTMEKKEQKGITSLQEYKRSVVTKKSESSTSEGLGLTFIDDYGNGKRDTISIFILNPRTNFIEIQEPVKDEKQFLDLTKGATGKKTEPVQKNAEKGEVVPGAKKNCGSVAAENDFLKLRKKMAAETSDDAMVSAAAKNFKTKCFTVTQIKNLSTLFLNDNGKYKFFDAAYAHVADPDSFPSLATELKDEYYLNRFKAMLH